MKYIQVKTQFEDLHCWPQAPNKVSFLRNPHRHIFVVEVLISVVGVDRELEFFLFKDEVEMYIEQMNLGIHKSCEMIGEYLLKEIESNYPDRSISVSVSEDGENGSVVNNF